MGEINNFNESNSLERLTDDLLKDVRSAIDTKEVLELPIAELSLLGTTVAALLPTFRTVTETTTFNTAGLYKIVNALPDDTLKKTGKGDVYAILYPTKGKSKLAKI